MTYTLCALLGAALLGLDQWVKQWTVSRFAAPVPPISTGPPTPPGSFSRGW